MRILVITPARFARCDDLEERGATVRTVGTLDDATEALTAFWPDEVVIRMPWSAEVQSWVARNCSRGVKVRSA